MKMCQALSHVGHEVTLFAPDAAHELEVYAGGPFSFYGVQANFTIKQLPWGSFRGRGYWYGWRAAWRVRKAGFDLAFGRNLAACCFAAYLGVPVVYEVHRPVESDGRLARHLFQRLICSESFSCLVVITEALRRHFEERWPELKGRILVAPDGADCLEGKVQAVDLGRSAERMQVGYTGHLYTGKGAELVLELARSRPQFDFHVVGGADTDLRRWRARKDVPENLKLHGYKPHVLVPSYLMAFDVVLLPNQPRVLAHGGSRDIGEWTSPLKLFEYMAAGRPIICSNVPVLQEVAKDGLNMLVCQYDDVEDWVAALDRMASEPDLRFSLGAVAREQLENHYSWVKRAQHIIDGVVDFE